MICWHKHGMRPPLLSLDGKPFVLLDDARPETKVSARLYASPVEIIATRLYAEVLPAFEALRMATRGGLHAAGFISYDAGQSLSPGTVDSQSKAETPLLWFGLFRDCENIAADDVATLLPDERSAWVGAPEPMLDQAAYAIALAQVKELIAAGDIYQANLTFQAKVSAEGHPLAIYAGLRRRARSGYGGIVHDGTHWTLSCSPELFFACDGARIETRPMKGTAKRGASLSDDVAAQADLQNDPKQRAENLMIVDLMRNDLSRVARAGSVAVPELFKIETYPSIHQMTSIVAADMEPKSDAIDVLAALFPCGSITGAPKMRAREILRTIEPVQRGLYTGAIGRIDAGGRSASFNVAIRTLDATAGRIGLGSGVVADSQAQSEWDECLAKGAFVASDRRFDLLETIAFDPNIGLLRLELHIARMQKSASALGFAFDRHAARNELQAATFRLRVPARVRFMLSARGNMAIAIGPMPEPPKESVGVAIRPLPTNAHDFRLRHKTTDRSFYDESRAATCAFEVVFCDDAGRLTEGSFTNIFVDDGNGSLLTPALQCGLLGGVLRADLIAQGKAREAILTARDLGTLFFVGNALRGLLPAHKVEL